MGIYVMSICKVLLVQPTHDYLGWFVSTSPPRRYRRKCSGIVYFERWCQAQNLSHTQNIGYGNALHLQVCRFYTSLLCCAAGWHCKKVQGGFRLLLFRWAG